MTDKLKTNARELRRNQTDCERVLWSKLRNRQFLDLKFRRQHKIDYYIVDFICLENKIIIELDGGQHNTPEGISYDQDRTKHLQSKGYKILRFWNNDVLKQTDSVLEKIRMAVEEGNFLNPHPNPLPGRERE